MASLVIGLNWGGFIWGVNNGHVVEVSLGYFINPLVTVLLGVIVLGERLRRLQWVAISIAAVAVIGLTIDYGQPPWVAFLLAGSFGTYGLMSNRSRRGGESHLRDDRAHPYRLRLSDVVLIFSIVRRCRWLSYLLNHE